MTQEEKIYKTMGKAGVWNIVIAIIIMVTGIVSGIMLLISGAKLLLRKGDVII